MIRIIYFDERGNLKRLTNISPKPEELSSGILNMFMVKDRILSTNPLPGLKTNTWLGSIFIESEAGYPMLIPGGKS